MLDIEDLYQEYPEVFDFIEKSLEPRKHVPAPWLTRHFTNTKVVLTYKSKEELYLEVAELLPQFSESFIKFVDKVLTSPESFDCKDSVFIDRDNLFKLNLDSQLRVIEGELKFTQLEMELLNAVIINFYYNYFVREVTAKAKQDVRTEERKHFDKIYGGG